MLSIILPSYNEELIIEKTAQVLADIMETNKIKYELIFVNDGSKDRTWEVICAAAEANPSVRGVLFSKNFGKEAAIFAGLAEAQGECCVVLDCDLQHPPEKIVEMYHLWEMGYEVIEGVKKSRGKENIVHKIGAGTFYKIMSSATKIDMSRASDFKLLDRKAVDVILSMPEKNIFFRALSSWVGFRSTQVEFDVREREAGESKWSMRSLISYAISNIVAFSAVPMQIVTVAGVVVFVMGIALGLEALIRFFMGQAVEGFTTVILLILIIGSIIMMCMGIIGYYISMIYEEVKNRPRYIIAGRTKNTDTREEH